MRRPVNIKIASATGLGSFGQVGLLKVEPLDTDFDRIEAADLRRPRTVRIARNESTSLDLSPGTYIASLRAPSGKVLRTVFDVADSGAADVLLGARTTRKGRDMGAASAVDTRGYSRSVSVKAAAFEARSVDAGPVFRAATPQDRSMIESLRSGVPEHLRSRAKPSLQLDVESVVLTQMTADVRADEVSLILDAKPSLENVPNRLLPRGWTKPEVRSLLGMPIDTQPLRELRSTRKKITVELTPTKSGGLAKYVLLSRESGEPLQLARLPSEWYGVRTHEPCPITVQASLGNGGKYSLAVDVGDSDIQSLLGFIRQGDLEAALVILEDCLSFLASKQENPYAAAAAGYVLLNVPRGRIELPWQTWIGNLGRWYVNLPDGQIQHASLLLQSDSEELGLQRQLPSYFPHTQREKIQLAQQLLTESLKRGLPVYRAGLRLLTSNLRILLNSEYADQASAARLYELCSWFLMRVDPKEPFTVIEVGDLG